MKRRVAIIDYDIGNVKSISNALGKIGAGFSLTRKPDEILSADALILPGVGAFRSGMDNLKRYGLVETIAAFVRIGKPFLGICLGLQLLMEESEEFGLTKGLGLLRGRVEKLPSDTAGMEKIPHVGWNCIDEPNRGRWRKTIFDDLPTGSDVYFVHSFAVKPADEEVVLSRTFYAGTRFCSAVHSGNIYGCQFHPEKSGKTGLKMLSNFINLIKE